MYDRGVRWFLCPSGLTLPGTASRLSRVRCSPDTESSNQQLGLPADAGRGEHAAHRTGCLRHPGALGISSGSLCAFDRHQPELGPGRFQHVPGIRRSWRRAAATLHLRPPGWRRPGDGRGRALRLRARGDSQCPSLVTCDPPLFTRFCVAGGQFIVNPNPPRSCTVAVETKPWGRIKRMYR